MKPTDYCLNVLREKSPTEAAMIDNIASLRMTADDGASSYFNILSHVADYAFSEKKINTGKNAGKSKVICYPGPMLSYR